MNPEEINNLKMRITELERQMSLLKNSSTIPQSISEAIKARVFIEGGKAAASETQAVNEGGAGTYNVAMPMDGFLQTPEGKFIPYYN